MNTNSDFKFGVEKARKFSFEAFFYFNDGNKIHLTKVSENKRDEIYEKLEKVWILLFS